MFTNYALRLAAQSSQRAKASKATLGVLAGGGLFLTAASTDDDLQLTTSQEEQEEEIEYSQQQQQQQKKQLSIPQTQAETELLQQHHHVAQQQQQKAPTTTTEDNSQRQLIRRPAGGLFLDQHLRRVLSMVQNAPSAASSSDPTIASALSAGLHTMFSATAAPRRVQCDGVGFALMSRLVSGPKEFYRNRINSGVPQQAVQEKATLEQKYEVDFKNPIGEGAFGSVYKGTCRETGEQVAIKKISKEASKDDDTFHREIAALKHIHAHGDHPNICGMRDHYVEGNYSYVVLDLISGGEMFDHLCNHGAYSEADAARMIREVVCALSFLHGLNCVHGDLKPENLLLSSESSSAVVKLVDFGSAQIRHVDEDGEIKEEEPVEDAPRNNATPAYSPPEFLENKTGGLIDPSFDMWAVGVILYIMLTGVHPFDLYGERSDEEIEDAIRNGYRPPTRRSPLTAHLSGHAILLLEQLLEWDPKKRMTALQLLDHPWVKGETARRKKMADSDKRLSAYRTFKTKFEAKVFAEMVNFGADNGNTRGGGIAKRTSLIERAFRVMDPDDRGYVTTNELREMAGEEKSSDDGQDHQLSLSGFQDLLSENMKNKYFQKGDLVYNQGEEGHTMYFINSGSVEVFTKDGSKQTRTTGDCFGEGALLHPNSIRSATIRCLTPVHAIEVSREYFEKYLANDDNVKINLREKDKSRKRQRAKAILQSIQHMKEKNLRKGRYVFRSGQEGTEMYVLEEGEIELQINGHLVAPVHAGEMTGEHSLIFGKPRNVDAVCVSKGGCKLFTLPGSDYFSLLDTSPTLKEGIREICFRREFKKAVTREMDKAFPTTEAGLIEAFYFLDSDKKGYFGLDDVREMIKNFDPTYTEEDIRNIMASISGNETGKVTWKEFKAIFGTTKKD